MTTARQRLAPIIWGIDLAAEPACYEVLFLAGLDDDHRVSRAAFANPPAPPATERQAMIAARIELDGLTDEQLLVLARSSELVER